MAHAMVANGNKCMQLCANLKMSNCKILPDIVDMVEIACMRF